MKTILILAVLAVACADDNSTTEPSSKQPQKQQPRVVPNYVTVEHILIGVAGNPRMKQVTRTNDDAKQLVDDILAQLDEGTDFEKLKQQHSDDRGRTGRANGPYDMANRGMNPGSATPRENMVPGFGDVSFSLEVGEVGVAEYDPAKSPFGYHIVKRVK